MELPVYLSCSAGISEFGVRECSFVPTWLTCPVWPWLQSRQIPMSRQLRVTTTPDSVTHQEKRPSVAPSFSHSEAVSRKPKQKQAFWLTKTSWHISQIVKINHLKCEHPRSGVLNFRKAASKMTHMPTQSTINTVIFNEKSRIVSENFWRDGACSSTFGLPNNATGEGGRACRVAKEQIQPRSNPLTQPSLPQNLKIPKELGSCFKCHYILF